MLLFLLRISLLFPFLLFPWSVDAKVWKNCTKLFTSRLSDPSDPILSLPPSMRGRWEKATKIDFPIPISAIDYIRLKGTSIFDFGALSGISEKKLLESPDLDLGWIDSKAAFVEGIMPLSDGKTEVLLRIPSKWGQGRRYRVQIESKNPFVANYRTSENKPLFKSVMEFDMMSKDERAWLDTEDAVGSIVATSEKGLYRRVNNLQFSDLGLSWKDENTGLVWSKPPVRLMHYDEAMLFCGDRRASLPTVEIFFDLVKKKGHKLRNRDFFPRYWTSSKEPSFEEGWLERILQGESHPIFGFDVSSIIDSPEVGRAQSLAVDEILSVLCVHF